jgi:Protein of unknown function (DUF2844)
MMLSPPPRRPLRRFPLCPEVPSPRQEPSAQIREAGWKNKKRAHFPSLAACLTAFALLGFSLPASASLGGRATSVESDRAQMNASHRVTQHDGYEVHEVQAPGGTVVNEYVSAAGTVFAVAWHGQFPPPMEQILGTYFQQYSAALQARPRMYGHRPVNIEQQGLVVQTGGHMRAHFGRAYDPNLLPQGVNVNQIQ